MTTAANLNDALQSLVDERLDAIDRVLMHTGVPRAERGGIVGEVEGQIHELLSRRIGESESSRADVLAVLATLDPPESYAPEGYRGRPASRRPTGPRASATAICGLAAAALHGLTALFAFALWFTSNRELFALTCCVAVLFALLATFLGGWAVVQIRESCGEIYGLPAAALAVAQLPVLLLNVAITTLIVVLDEAALILLAGCAVLACNVSVLAICWRLICGKWFCTAER